MCGFEYIGSVIHESTYHDESYLSPIQVDSIISLDKHLLKYERAALLVFRVIKMLEQVWY